MVDIKTLCLNFDKELSSITSKEDVLLSCVSTKLGSLYTAQSEKLDVIIEELNKSIDTDDMEYTYRVIKKLAKSLSNNRVQLLQLIEEVNS